VRQRVLGVLGVAGAIVGVVIGSHAFESATTTDTLANTLPQMVGEFGGSARVVQIIVDSGGVNYQVIGSDGLLHTRDYGIRTSQDVEGTATTHEVENTQRHPTTAERRGAIVTLSKFEPGVVDDLYRKVGFPSSSSSATFSDGHWLLQTGSRPFDKYEARYDGSGLRQTQSEQSTFGNP
jgi:hypothetical protein